MISAREMGSKLRRKKEIWITRGKRRVNVGELGLDRGDHVIYQCAPSAGSTSKQMIYEDCFSFGVDEWSQIQKAETIEINVATERKTYRCPMERARKYGEVRYTRKKGDRFLVPLECWTVYDLSKKVLSRATLRDDE